MIKDMKINNEEQTKHGSYMMKDSKTKRTKEIRDFIQFIIFRRVYKTDPVFFWQKAFLSSFPTSGLQIDRSN